MFLLPGSVVLLNYVSIGVDLLCEGRQGFRLLKY
jgi:hypothetical protein